jgi:hypothetical protein
MMDTIRGPNKQYMTCPRLCSAGDPDARAVEPKKSTLPPAMHYETARTVRNKQVFVVESISPALRFSGRRVIHTPFERIANETSGIEHVTAFIREIVSFVLICQYHLA